MEVLPPFAKPSYCDFSFYQLLIWSNACKDGICLKAIAKWEELSLNCCGFFPSWLITWQECFWMWRWEFKYSMNSDGWCSLQIEVTNLCLHSLSRNMYTVLVMESSAFMPFASSSCKARIGTSPWKVIHQLPNTFGKNKHCNNWFGVVPTGGRRQAISLILLSVPRVSARSVTVVIHCRLYFVFLIGNVFA